MAENDFKLSNLSYTAKDFQTIYPELLESAKKLAYQWDPTISNESDPGVVLIKLNALIGDKLNYNIDKNILETFPLSVTQEDNARNLYSQLGYRMKWYRSAITAVSLKWQKTETLLSDSTVLPMFTMVTNDDSSVVYTLLDKVLYDSENFDTIYNISAIQGVIHEYQINNSSNITINNLNSSNRIYFDDYNVAENGIFINKLDSEDWAYWTKVDNLAVQSLGQYVYEFGIDTSNKTCYIEFPMDAADLIGKGINIHYITTSGLNGNISSNVLTKLYKEISATDTNNGTVTLNSDYITINNLSAAIDGQNPESIDDAYLNYKKTVGTFETLVTLRDYINAINNSGYVSNSIICDRTNDIQSTYYIISENSETAEVETTFVKESSEKDELDAFGLKLYLLQSVNVINSISDYEKSFSIIPSSETQTIIQYIDNKKSIEHNFNDILVDRYFMFKNKFDINCKIIPYYKLTNTQASEIKLNIVKALYKSLSAKNINFGEKVSYDKVYDIIINSDKRIRAIMLDDINYTTYAVYWTGAEFKEVPINNDAGYQEQIAPTQFIVSKSVPKNWSSVFTDYYERKGYAGNYTYSQLQKYRAPSAFEYIYNTYYSINAIINQPPTWESTYDDYFIYDMISNNFIPNTTNVWSSNTFYSITPTSSAPPVDWEYNYGAYYTRSGISPNYVYSPVQGELNEAPTWQPNTYYIPAVVDFRKDIYAKSVLAGKTQFLKPITDFLYTLNQSTNTLSENVENISTYLTLDIKGLNTSSTDYVLKDNESIIFIAPRLKDTANYSTFVKFSGKLKPSTTSIPYNTSYKLTAGEYLVCFYKEATDSTEDQDNPYKAVCYGPGNIIKPSFTIQKANLVSTFDSYSNGLADGTKKEYIVSYGTADYESIKSLSTTLTLSSSKSITIQEYVKDTIYSSSGYQFYWITKTVNNDNYVLNFDANGEYVLQNSEYFIYTNKDRSLFNVLGSGFKLKVSDTNNTGLPLIWNCPIIEYSAIAQNGYSAIDENNSFVSGVELLSSLNAHIDLQDMQIINIPQRYTINFSTSASTNELKLTSTKFTNVPTDCVISYTALDGTSDAIPQLNLDDAVWRCKTQLNIDVSATNYQVMQNSSTTETLTSIQVVLLNSTDGTQTIVCPGYEIASFEAPTWSNTDTYYQLVEGKALALSNLSKPVNWENIWKYCYTDSSCTIPLPPNDWDTNYNTYYVLDEDKLPVLNDTLTYELNVYLSPNINNSVIYLLSDYVLQLSGGENINTLLTDIYGNTSSIKIHTFAESITNNLLISNIPAADGSISIEVPVNYTNITSNDLYESNKFRTVTKQISKPADWDNFYYKYYRIKTGNVYYPIVSGTAPTWQSNTFYTISDILTQTSAPADWSTTTKYVKICNTVIDYIIPINLPKSKYILPLRNSDENVSYKLTLYDIDEQEDIKNLYTIETSNQSGILINYSGVSYISIDFTNIVSTKNYGIKLSVNKITVEDNKSYIIAKPYFSYTVNESTYNSYIDRIRALDTEGKFNYTYIVSSDKALEDPLDSTTATKTKSSGECFLNENHIFNKFTICKSNYENSITITDKIK